VYHISIVQESGSAGMTIDGEAREGGAIPMVDDRREHVVEVRLGAAPENKKEELAADERR
jgi:hypothetical protein